MSDAMDKLRKRLSTPKPTSSTEPLWRGPEEDGITYSLLCRFLNCRERFRLLVVEGLQPAAGFNHRIEYGSMWHVCEESIASERSHFGEVVGTTLWQDNLLNYARFLAQKYPTEQNQISHWYEVCRAQFPVYWSYWSQHPDVTSRTPLLQETSFSVPYRLPSGRTVRLRGKWDSVDLVGEGKGRGIWLQENKTKGDIKEAQLRRQLTFDLQTMLYLIALQEEWAQGQPWSHVDRSARVLGVRYNVVRRPLSGGRHSIVQHKPTKSNPQGETRSAYYKRLRGLIESDPGFFFMRWQCYISAQDIQKFKTQCLDPILEQLCDWWDTVTTYEGGDIWSCTNHWRHPFGVWNALDEGGSSDLDEYLATGSELGLTRTNNLFPELT